MDWRKKESSDRFGWPAFVRSTSTVARSYCGQVGVFTSGEPVSAKGFDAVVEWKNVRKSGRRWKVSKHLDVGHPPA